MCCLLPRMQPALPTWSQLWSSQRTSCPQHGTTDPAILANIPPLVSTASVDEAAPQATVMPMAADTQDPAQTSAVGVPRLITRRQQTQALAAWRRAKQAAAAAGPAAKGLVTAQSVSGMLQQHNTYRATHGAPAMVWDTTLANAAQAWANGCQCQHGSSGENLYWGSGNDLNAAAAAATQLW
jgi:uncharacterized protein YkwD